MILRALFLILLLAGRAVPVHAGEDEDLLETVPPAEAAEGPSVPALVRNDDLSFVRRRGIDLYERHQAALVALEAAQEVGLADLVPEGWLTLRETDGMRVRFVGTCADGPCALIDVLIDEERLSAEALYPPAVLTPEQAEAWAVKQRVFEVQDATCQVPYNAVALPPEDDDGVWTVYLVPQPAEGDVVAVSGHVRVRVDAATAAVLTAEDFSASCILVRRAPEQTQLAIDYGWAPMPAETHVLNSLLHQLLFFVGTQTGIYRVNGDSIERVADVGPPS